MRTWHSSCQAHAKCTINSISWINRREHGVYFPSPWIWAGLVTNRMQSATSKNRLLQDLQLLLLEHSLLGSSCHAGWRPRHMDRSCERKTDAPMRRSSSCPTYGWAHWTFQTSQAAPWPWLCPTLYGPEESPDGALSNHWIIWDNRWLLL